MLQTFGLVGFILTFVGSFMIGYTAIKVHHRFWREHAVDEKVFQEMRRERNVGIIGLLFLVLGFMMELSIRLSFLTS